MSLDLLQQPMENEPPIQNVGQTIREETDEHAIKAKKIKEEKTQIKTSDKEIQTIDMDGFLSIAQNEQIKKIFMIKQRIYKELAELYAEPITADVYQAIQTLEDQLGVV